MLPLTGVRILAVEQYGAGPFGSMQLAYMGAEVIKIENPKDGGDVSRTVMRQSDRKLEGQWRFSAHRPWATTVRERHCP